MTCNKGERRYAEQSFVRKIDLRTGRTLRDVWVNNTESGWDLTDGQRERQRRRGSSRCRTAATASGSRLSRRCSRRSRRRERRGRDGSG
jgi:hypothetical protein